LNEHIAIGVPRPPLLALVCLAFLGCGRPATIPAVDVVPIAPARPGKVLAVTSDSGVLHENARCADREQREAELAAAWAEDDRVHYCVRTAPDGDDPGYPLTCSSVGKAGDYRVEPARLHESARISQVPLRTTSADGKYAFRLTGGEREPHKATGALVETRSGRIVKKAPIDYDEHIALDGWIGSGVVFRTWVEEGPGCTLALVDPRVDWPSGYEHVKTLGGCYDGAFTLKPDPNTYAVLDAGGASVAFVDENSLEVTQVETDRQGGPVMGTAIVPWLEGSELVVVYGAPISGDVVRIDLRKRSLVARASPASCGAKPEK
jgi:hypothetical protein